MPFVKVAGTAGDAEAWEVDEAAACAGELGACAVAEAWGEELADGADTEPVLDVRAGELGACVATAAAAAAAGPDV